MKLKKVLTLAIALVMVLSLVTVPSIGVSAVSMSAEKLTEYGWNFDTGEATDKPYLVSWLYNRHPVAAFSVPGYKKGDVAKATLSFTSALNNGTSGATTATIFAIDPAAIEAKSQSELSYAVANRVKLGTVYVGVDGTVTTDPFEITDAITSDGKIGIYLSNRAEDGCESVGISTVTDMALTVDFGEATTVKIITKYVDGVNVDEETTEMGGVLAESNYTYSNPKVSVEHNGEIYVIDKEQSSLSTIAETDGSGEVTIVYTPLDEHLTAYYSFDDVDDIAKDYSGLGRDGEIVGDIQSVGGVNGYALETFGGSNGTCYMQMGDDILKDSNGNCVDSFTMSAWINRKSGNGNSFALSLNCAEPNSGTGYPKEYLGLINKDSGTDPNLATNLLSFEFCKNHNIRYALKPNKTITTGIWAHYAVSYDSNSGTAVMYIDGEEVLREENIVFTLNDFTESNNYIARSPWYYDNDYKAVFDEVRIYSVALDEKAIQKVMSKSSDTVTVVKVTATYQVNGETVATQTAYYDTEKADGAVFNARTHVEDGGNYIYVSEAVTLSEDTIIDMKALANPDVNGYAMGKTVVIDDNAYTIESGNLIPNGDFSEGLVGWYNGQDAAATATLNGDGTVTINSGGASSEGALYRSWAIEPGKTYVFTYTANSSNKYHVTSFANVCNASSDNEESLIRGGSSGVNEVEGKNNIVFTNTDNYAYVRMSFRWAVDDVVGQFGLYEITPTITAPENITDLTVNFIERDTNEAIKPSQTLQVYKYTTYSATDAQKKIVLDDKTYVIDEDCITSVEVGDEPATLDLRFRLDSCTLDMGSSMVFTNDTDKSLSVNITQADYNIAMYTDNGNVVETYGWKSSFGLGNYITIKPKTFVKITSVGNKVTTTGAYVPPVMVSNIPSDIACNFTTVPVFKKNFIENGDTYRFINTTGKDYSLLGNLSECDYVIYDKYGDYVGSRLNYDGDGTVTVPADGTIDITSCNSSVWVLALYDQFTVIRQSGEPAFEYVRIPKGETFTFTNYSRFDLDLSTNGKSYLYSVSDVNGGGTESSSTNKTLRVAHGKSAKITSNSDDLIVYALSKCFTISSSLDNENIIDRGESVCVENVTDSNVGFLVSGCFDYVIYDADDNIMSYNYGWSSSVVDGKIELEAGNKAVITAGTQLILKNTDELKLYPSLSGYEYTKYAVAQPMTVKNISDEQYPLFVNTDIFICDIYDENSDLVKSFTSAEYDNTVEIGGGCTAVISSKKGSLTVRALRNVFEVDLPQVNVSGVSLNKTELTIEEGSSTAVTATIEPTSATIKAVLWESSDTSVASVTNGRIYAISEGEADISVKTVDGGYTYTCHVTVLPAVAAVESVVLDVSLLTICENETAVLNASVRPVSAKNRNVIWSSEDESVAKVDQSGTVVGVSEGITTITVTTEEGGYTASCIVDVKPIRVKAVALDKTAETLYEGESLTLVATITPDTAINKNVEWTSSDESVATVENGVVTAIKAGTATIAVTTEDGGYTASCVVTVKEPTISVSGVTLNKTSASMTVGETETLSATVSPSNATNKNVVWKSSNAAVATVENGVVTAVKAGTATITVTTVDGSKSASCEVTVKPAYTEISKAELTVGSASTRTGETVTVPILISKNPGIAGFNIEIHYDRSAFTPVSIAKGEVLTAGSLVSNIQQGGDMTQYETVTAFWSNPANITANGVILNVVFAVNEGVEDGEYPISATYEMGDVTNQDYEDIGLDIVNGAIHVESIIIGDVRKDGVVNTKDSVRLGQYLAKWSIALSDYEEKAADIHQDGVINTKDSVKLGQYLAKWEVELALFAAGDNKISFEVGEIQAEAGGYVDVPVVITENSGVAGFNVEVGYDKDVLTPVSITQGDVLTVGSLISNIQQGGDMTQYETVTAFWSNPANMTDVGEAFVIRFKVNEKATGESPITLSYTEGDICDQYYNDLDVALVNGKVVIGEEENLDYSVNSLTGTVRNGSFYAEVEVTKNSDRNEKDVVVIAVYKDGVMTDMTYMKAKFAKGQTVTFGGKLTGVDGAELKAFVWNDFSGMKCLSNVIVK